MERWLNRVAVVTGASSGIGEALVKDLVAAGLIVVGLARRVDRIEEIRKSLPGGQQNRLHAKKCDVSNESEVIAVFDWIESTLGGTDILVNNAGIQNQGHLVTLDTKLIQNVLNINVMGIVYCTQQAFKSMKARNFDGHVVLVNSILGHYPYKLSDPPCFNIYPASKFAVTAMTEVYRQELTGLGTRIKITSISPGGVNTEIITDQMREHFPLLDPHDVSNAIVFAISTPPHVQIHELTIKPIGEMV